MVNVELLPEVNSKGNLSLLDEPLTALFCSNRCPGDLIIRTYDLARAMRDAGVPVIGGFQTPMERECLRRLLRGNQPVVVCPARSIDNMRTPRDWRPALDDGRLLVLVALPIHSPPPHGGARGPVQRPGGRPRPASLHCPRSKRRQNRSLRPQARQLRISKGGKE